MPLRLYRVCRAKHAKLDGYGALIAGGRWNSPGRAVVYLAESVALAVLENLVHMAREDFPTGYVVVCASLPGSVSLRTEEQLRDIFPRVDAPTWELGDYWLDSGMSAALKVQSRVIPGEHNFLLNPVHPDFQAVEVEAPIPFRFDPRLFA
jgi:RES domain-containing protein